MPEPFRIELERAEGDADALASLLDRDDVKNTGRRREQVAVSLGETRHPSAAETLERLALSDDDRTVRAIAVNSLRRLPDPPSEHLLVELLHDPDAVVRKEACRASQARLSRDPAPRLVLAIGRLTADAWLPTALDAIRTLAAAGNEATMTELASRAPHLRGSRRVAAWVRLRTARS